MVQVQIPGIRKVAGAILAAMIVSIAPLAYGFDGDARNQGDGVERSRENGVTVWRVKPAPPPMPAIPALLGDAPLRPKVIVKKKTIIVPRFRPAKIRVTGHFSGYGKRIPFVQGFYAGYPRSKNSRPYVQGFYSGHKINKKRRFPLERPDGRRRYSR